MLSALTAGERSLTALDEREHQERLREAIQRNVRLQEAEKRRPALREIIENKLNIAMDSGAFEALFSLLNFPATIAFPHNPSLLPELNQMAIDELEALGYIAALKGDFLHITWRRPLRVVRSLGPNDCCAQEATPGPAPSDTDCPLPPRRRTEGRWSGLDRTDDAAEDINEPTLSDPYCSAPRVRL
jgi:hypothetical protein